MKYGYDFILIRFLLLYGELKYNGMRHETFRLNAVVCGCFQRHNSIPVLRYYTS